jgi:NADPH:quinone reductase-like Zn-dependent oxidoreductase
VVDRRRSVALPPGGDAAALAAAMNPGMSAWIALCCRIAFQPGQTVLVLGATGNAGRMAVEIARHLGAGLVIGTGRDVERLAGVGADVTVTLDDLGAAAAEVAELPALAAEIAAGAFTVDAAPVPLSQVEAAWEVPVAPGRRVVFTP